MIAALLLAFVALLASGAAGSKSYKRDYKKDMVGTWVNPEYDKYAEVPAEIDPKSINIASIIVSSIFL